MSSWQHLQSNDNSLIHFLNTDDAGDKIFHSVFYKEDEVLIRNDSASNEW